MGSFLFGCVCAADVQILVVLGSDATVEGDQEVIFISVPVADLCSCPDTGRRNSNAFRGWRKELR